MTRNIIYQKRHGALQTQRKYKWNEILQKINTVLIIRCPTLLNLFQGCCISVPIVEFKSIIWITFCNPSSYFQKGQNVLLKFNNQLILKTPSLKANLVNNLFIYLSLRSSSKKLIYVSCNHVQKLCIPAVTEVTIEECRSLNIGQCRNGMEKRA